MRNLTLEAKRFADRKSAAARESAQFAALALVGGIDFTDALTLDATRRRHVVTRLTRLIERERLKGAARHWSYDLNRHIALKQARDRLRADHRSAK